MLCFFLGACSGISQTTPASNLPLNSNSSNGSAIPLPIETAQANNKVPVYWLGAANQGFLYREFLRLNSGDDPIRAALQLMTSTKPLDPRYMTPWSKASKIAASVSGRTSITVDLSADAFAGKVSNETAQLAVQQLVYTATAAASNAGLVDSGQNVQVTVLVDGHTDFNAFDQVKLDRPLTRDAGVQAPIWIIDPQQGAVFESNTVNIGGRASLSSGSLQWELYLVDAQGVPGLTQKGSASSAAAAQAGNFAFSLDLPSGKYQLKVFGTDSNNPSAQLYLEDKTFTVK
ncbi:MAG: GerMN domain-containing protein [Renibacterium salmoninarum]|nr:GerMN domain-containing protein [Renibacterium salmoninarum]